MECNAMCALASSIFSYHKNFGRSAGAATLGLRPGAAAVQVTTSQSPETHCYNLPATHRLNGLRAKDGITSKTLRRSASRELVVAAAAALIHLRCRWEVGNVLLHCSTQLSTLLHTAPHCSPHYHTHCFNGHWRSSLPAPTARCNQTTQKAMFRKKRHLRRC